MKKVSGIILTIVGLYGMFISWYMVISGEIDDGEMESRLFTIALISIVILVIGVYKIHNNRNND